MDQYGEELDLGKKSDYTFTVKNVTKDYAFQDGEAGFVEYDSENDYFYLDTTGQVPTTGKRIFSVGDEIKVTAVHNESGVSTTKTLEVTEASELASVEFGDVELPKDAERLSEDVEGAKIPYEAKDQYGNDVELDTEKITLVSSDKAVLSVANDNVTFEKDDDGNKYLQIEGFGKAGDVTLRLISTQTGDVFNHNLEVLQKAGEVNSVELEHADIDIAENSNPVFVDVNVTDNYGNDIKPKDYLNGDKFTINTSNKGIAEAEFVTDQDNKNYGKLQVNGLGSEGDTAQIDLVVNETGEKASLNVSIGEEAQLSKVVVKDDYKSKLVKGSSSTVEFELQDQYGNEIALPDGYQATAVASDEKVLDVTPGSGDYEYNVEALKAGKTDVKFTVKESADEDAKTVASTKAEFEVKANNTDDLEFSVEDIPTLSKDAADENSEYAEKVKVTAEDNAGNEYVIPQSEIVSMSTSDKNLAKAKQNSDGDWVVYGQDGTFDGKDQTVTLSVVFNAENEVKTITKDITVSKDELAASKVEFYDKALDGKKVDKDAKAVSTFSVDVKENGDFKNDKNVYAVVEDQFGLYTEATTTGGKFDEVETTIKNVEGLNFSAETVFIDGDGKLDLESLEATKASVDTEKASFRVVFTTENGKAGYVDVNVKNVDKLETAESLVDTSVQGITVGGVEAVLDEGTGEYNVELPKETDLDSEVIASNVVATPTNSNATVETAQKSENGKKWTVDVKAADGTTTKTYTINVTAAE